MPRPEMAERRRGEFLRSPLAVQFLVASLVILVAGMVVIGAFLAGRIESGVLSRTAGVTALYVDSFISPHLQGLATGTGLPEQDHEALDALLETTPLGRRIVAFKVWGADGTVLHSTAPQIVGRQFPIKEDLASALAGRVTSGITDLTEPENEFERGRWDRLIETYAPVRGEGTDAVIAVSEFYQLPDELDAEVAAAQRRSWLIVGGATVVMYAALAGLVGRAGGTIVLQQRALSRSVERLSGLLEENAHLSERVRRAAVRTTSLNEQFLRRVSADLHDGPAQDVGVALLWLSRLRASTESLGHNRAQLDRVHEALEHALSELRRVSSGLRIPEIEKLSMSAVIARVVRDYEQRTDREVELRVGEFLSEASPAIKVVGYRVIQESLMNGFRHAGAGRQWVQASGDNRHVWFEVGDTGTGFDPNATGDGRLGLAGMRERVEVLGGTFEAISRPGEGTRIVARLPLVAGGES